MLPNLTQVQSNLGHDSRVKKIYTSFFFLKNKWRLQALTLHPVSGYHPTTLHEGASHSLDPASEQGLVLPPKYSPLPWPSLQAGIDAATQKVTMGTPAQRLVRTESVNTEVGKGTHHRTPARLKGVPGTNIGAPPCWRWHGPAGGACWGEDPTPSPRITEPMGVVTQQLPACRNAWCCGPRGQRPPAFAGENTPGSKAECVPQQRAMLDGEEVQHQPCSPCTVQKRRWPRSPLPLHLPAPVAMKGLLTGGALPAQEKARARGIKHALLCTVAVVPSTSHHRLDFPVTQNMEPLSSFPPPSFFFFNFYF